MDIHIQLGQDCRTQDARLCQGSGEGQHHHHPLCPGQLRRVLWVWRKDRGPPNDHHPLHSLCRRPATGIHRKQRRTRRIGDSITLNNHQPFLSCFFSFAQCCSQVQQGITKILNEKKTRAGRQQQTKHIIDPTCSYFPLPIYLVLVYSSFHSISF